LVENGRQGILSALRRLRKAGDIWGGFGPAIIIEMVVLWGNSSVRMKNQPDVIWFENVLDWNNQVNVVFWWVFNVVFDSARVI
jgi:hypothetical protein